MRWVGFCSFNLHPFFIVPSASSFTCPHTHLSQNAQQWIPPSTTPVQDLNPGFQTSETQRNMPSFCQLPIGGNRKSSHIEL
eukprot:3478377-Ditylum_brightwellii.AAC.1